MKKQPKLFDKPWKHLVIVVTAVVLSYGLVSWAIDSGRLTAYFGAIVLGVVAVHHTIEAVKAYATKS